MASIQQRLTVIERRLDNIEKLNRDQMREVIEKALLIFIKDNVEIEMFKELLNDPPTK